MSKSVIPRGFSRFYLLSLLEEGPMTGKEIMVETDERTKGAWKPSPGLIYPLLGKLLAQGLLEEIRGGYKTTKKGSLVLKDYEESQSEFQDRFRAFIRLGVFGKYVAQDIVDKAIGVLGMVREDISRSTAKEKAKYEKFLREELDRLGKEKKS